MKTDHAIRSDVLEELRFSPDVDDTGVRVEVQQGIVTLSGQVPSALQKYRAEVAAKRIAGVQGIANDLVIRLPSGQTPSDVQIAEQAHAAIQAALPSVADYVSVTVHLGRVSLRGGVEWRFQRDMIESAVRALSGITGIDNAIAIKPRASPSHIKRQIEEAFHRSAQIDANAVTVETEGGTITLRGQVRSWSEREQAEDTAWSAPGVFCVKNEIDVIHI